MPDTTTTPVQMAAEARAKFFNLMKSASAHSDAENLRNARKSIDILDDIESKNISHHVFPRHASAGNDARIERLVSGIEDSVLFAGELALSSDNGADPDLAEIMPPRMSESERSEEMSEEEKDGETLGTDDTEDGRLYDSSEDQHSAIFSLAESEELAEAAEQLGDDSGEQDDEDEDDDDFVAHKKAKLTDSAKQLHLSVTKEQNELWRKNKRAMSQGKDTALSNYLYVATLERLGEASGLRAKILHEAEKGGKLAGQLARSITEIEALSAASLAVARKGHPTEMQEICDFVCGVVTPEQSVVTADGRCGITQQDCKADELLLISVSGNNSKKPIRKTKLISKHLIGLVQAVHMVTNLADVVRGFVVHKLTSLKDPDFDPNDCTVTEAFEKICANDAVKELRSHLKNALGHIDISVSLLTKK